MRAGHSSLESTPPRNRAKLSSAIRSPAGSSAKVAPRTPREAKLTPRRGGMLSSRPCARRAAWTTCVRSAWAGNNTEWSAWTSMARSSARRFCGTIPEAPVRPRNSPANEAMETASSVLAGGPAPRASFPLPLLRSRNCAGLQTMNRRTQGRLRQSACLTTG